MREGVGVLPADSSADIAAVAAEMGMQIEPELCDLKDAYPQWEDGPTRGV